MTLSKAVKNAIAEVRAREPVIDSFQDLQFSRGVLRTPDGPIPLKKIGSGMFATIYREQGGEGRVFAFSDDHVYDKEIAESAHDSLPKNPHIPAVEKYGATRDKTVYVMPFYHTPLRKSADPAGWNDYAIAKKCFDESRVMFYQGHRGFDVNHAVVECVKDRGVRAAVVDALDALKDTASNYSDEYVFELKPRNLAMDDNGNLVLLDVLVDRELVKQANKRGR